MWKNTTYYLFKMGSHAQKSPLKRKFGVFYGCFHLGFLGVLQLKSGKKLNGQA